MADKPKRYEIEILVGPCEYEQAEELLCRLADDDEISEAVHRLGGVFSLRAYDESQEEGPLPVNTTGGGVFPSRIDEKTE